MGEQSRFAKTKRVERIMKPYLEAIPQYMGIFLRSGVRAGRYLNFCMTT